MSDFARLIEIARDAGIPFAAPSVTSEPNVLPLTAVVGDVLTCTRGEWTGEPTDYAFSWQQTGNPAEINTGATYVARPGDAGKRVCCVVTATNKAGSTSSPPSNSVPVRLQA